MAFINYDKVPRKVLYWILMKTGSLTKYIDIINDIFDRIVANTRTCGGLTSDFLSQFGLHKDLH